MTHVEPLSMATKKHIKLLNKRHTLQGIQWDQLQDSREDTTKTPTEGRTRLTISAYVQIKSVYMYTTEITQSRNKPSWVFFNLLFQGKKRQVASQQFTKLYVLSQYGAKPSFLINIPLKLQDNIR